MKQNPWLGLASYDEQAVAQGYKFCGRERAINELYSIIDNNLLTTLYGKSGIGKSSLLQAGVFPHLRTDNYLPVMIRLGVGIAGDYSYTTVVMDAVRKAVAEAGGHCVAMQEGEAACEEERLWHFFHSTEFQSAGGDTLFPVIVLDQFEELYYRDKQQLSTLLKALYLLVDDSPLSGSDDDEVPNYRIVLSIREDDLFHLEDSIDKLRLTEMKYNRYRLRELTDDEARDIILLPGAHLFSPSEADAIANRIIQEAKAGSEEISTAVLSLLCSRIYYACPTLTDNSASTGITLQRITEFFRQAEGNFLKSFYDDIIKELKSPAKWYYIEDTLVTDEGRRNSVLKSEFDKMVPNSDFLFRGQKSMLRCITTAGTDEPRVEIIHDMLARQMMSSRNERKLQEQTKALRKQRITAIAIILLAIVLGAVFYTQYRSIVAERNSMLKMQSHYIAEKAEKLLEENNPLLAVRLLLAVLPKDLSKPKRPYIAKAEQVLRKVSYNMTDFVSCIKQDSSIYRIEFSHDGDHVVTATEDNCIRLWDVKTGKQEGKTIKHDTVAIKEIRLSVDNKHIVATDCNNDVRIWDIRTGRQLGKTIKHEEEVRLTEFCSAQNSIITATDSIIRIWNIETGEQQEETLKYNGLMAISPDKKHIVTIDSNIISIWNITTGVQEKKQYIEIPSLYENITGIQFVPNGKYIILSLSRNNRRWYKKIIICEFPSIKLVYNENFIADDKPIIRFNSKKNRFIIIDRDVVRDVETGRYILIQDYNTPWKYRHEMSVNRVFSLDGSYTATILDNKIIIKNVWDSEIIKTINYGDFINDINFSPCGKYFTVFSDNNRTLTIWDICQEKEIRHNIHAHSRFNPLINSIQFSPNGKYFATAAQDTVKIWDAETKMQIGKTIVHQDEVNSIQFSPNGKYFATAARDSTAKIWDTQNWEQVGKTIKHQAEVNSIQFSPDNKYVITAADSARIWETATGVPVGNAMGHVADISKAQFSPDSGKYIVTTGNFDGTIFRFNDDGEWETIEKDFTIKIWDSKTTQQVGSTIKHNEDIRSVQFSPDGKYLVTASADKTAMIWETATGRQIGDTIRHEGLVKSAQFSPDGKYVVTASADKTAMIWETATGRQIGDTIRHEAYVSSVHFSPNGKHFVTTSDIHIIRKIGIRARQIKKHDAIIWDTQTQKQVGKAMKHEDIVESTQFNPDGKYIVTASRDNTAKIWNAQTGDQVGESMKHDSDVYSAQFSPNGKYIVTASEDGTIKITEFIPSQELIDKYRELFRDWPLTEEELIEYNFK